MIFSRMPLPLEPVIHLQTGDLRLVEAISLIQEHTSIPIVMPEELTSEEVRDILTTARLLRDGVLQAPGPQAPWSCVPKHLTMRWRPLVPTARWSSAVTSGWLRSGR